MADWRAFVCRIHLLIKSWLVVSTKHAWVICHVYTFLYIYIYIYVYTVDGTYNQSGNIFARIYSPCFKLDAQASDAHRHSHLQWGGRTRKVAMRRAMGRHPLKNICLLAGGNMFLRYPLLGGINRKPEHKRNGATHFQSTDSQVTQKCFRQNLCASTLKMMLIIEFLFLLSGLFLPWVDADFSTKHFRSCVRVTMGLLTFQR